MLRGAPVLGFRPRGRGLQVLTVNDPKRRGSTRSPLTKAAAISSKMVLTIFSTAPLGRCGFCTATRNIHSDLIMLPLQPGPGSQGQTEIVKRAKASESVILVVPKPNNSPTSAMSPGAPVPETSAKAQCTDQRASPS